MRAPKTFPIPRRLTKRQVELVLAICDGDPKEGDWDISNLHSIYGRGASTQSLRCSLQILMDKNLVTLAHHFRRDQTRLIISATETARLWRRRFLGKDAEVLK